MLAGLLMASGRLLIFSPALRKHIEKPSNYRMTLSDRVHFLKVKKQEA